MKLTVISIVIAVLLVGGTALYVARPGADAGSAGNNVIMEDGRQIIEVKAKGGYLPRVTEAKAGVPTVLRVETQGTFDCSAALTIPKLNYRTTLLPSGIREIEVPPQESGSKLQGVCSMGMYNFEVRFS